MQALEAGPGPFGQGVQVLELEGDIGSEKTWTEERSTARGGPDL